MYQSVEGKLNNLFLAHTNALQPLFEAVANAIDAIEENKKNGSIIIYILRDENTLNDGKKSSMPISGFIVRDEGCGLNDENFKSFQTADSIKKAPKGGKGLGRFAMLKVFNRVSLESVYKDSKKYKKRSFDFVPKNSGIDNLIENTSNEKKEYTQVHMENIIHPYERYIPAKSETIAQRILEHFLSLYVLDNKPDIKIYDDENTINLITLFDELYGAYTSKDSFKIEDEEFDISYVKVFKKIGFNHSLHFSAHNRDVPESIVQLSSSYAPLNSAFTEDERDDPKFGEEFFFQIYLSSNYLDLHVNPQRTKFDFGRKDGSIPGLLLDEKVITEKVLEHFKSYATTYLEPIIQENRLYVEKFIRDKAPAYYHLLRNAPEKLENAGKHMHHERLEMYLYTAERHLEIETKKEGNILIKSLEEKPIDDEIKKMAKQYAERITDISKSNLTEYVIARKSVIELLDKLLAKLPKDGNYALEEDIHNLILPMRKIGDEVDYFDHNLWLLDDRLASQFFLGSDVSLRKTAPEIKSGKEPDIIGYDIASALGENEGYLNSVTIVEFKRPMRDLGKNDNPYDQIKGYINKINEQKSLTINGRPFENLNGLRFYVYIIMDILPRTKSLLENEDFELLPDGVSYYRYHKTYKSHIEVIPYKRVVEMAKQRNHAFFKKLGIE